MFSCYSDQSDLQPEEMSKLVTYLSMMMLLLAILGTTQVEGGPCQGVVKESELDECAEDLLTRSVSSISQVAKKCSATESCLKRENCPAVDEMYKMLKDDSVRERIIKTLKNQICNRKERAFCCKEEDKKVCPAGESCKDVSECTEVEEKVKRIQSGNLPYSESIKIYDNLKSRMCDSQSMFCCQDKEKTLNVSEGTFLPSAAERTCGLESSETSQFIIGGNNTKPGQYPFMALLGKKVRKIARGREAIIPHWVCGGSLINHWYVLTAAHCQDSTQPIAYVRLGDWDVSTRDCAGDVCLPPVQNFEIERKDFIIHEDYSQTTDTQRNVFNDIALIRLPRRAERNTGVKFACLPLTVAHNGLAEDGQEGVVIGWGHTRAIDAITHSGEDLTKHSIPKVTQQSATIQVVDKDRCDAVWKLTNGVQEGQMCAGGGKVDSCSGDSGGPFAAREKGAINEPSPWIVTGVVSFGSGYCGSGKPGVYTRVGHYMEWIRGQLEL
eukprot:GFUD01040669.1.p1 GENE.GFUD01040669.1~~GFUD01040669.1.p1  ORF type:complete len:496 (+),score=118.42 GFUD01040669.1:2-1489(+)